MKAKLFVLVLVGVFIAGVLGFPQMVYAIDAPTSAQVYPPAHAFQNCLETGDMLILAKYNIDYTTNPDEIVTEAYLVRLLDGITEYGSSAPYAYYDDGYGDGVFAIYMSASDAPTWDDSYTVRLQGNPTLSWSNSIPNTGVSSITWHTSLDDMPAIILGWADELEVAWSVNMVDSTVVGNKLSTYGEAYFTNSVPGLRAYCPAVFTTAILDIDTGVEREFDQTYATTLAQRWQSTTYGIAIANLAAYAGLSTLWFTSLVWVIVIVGASVVVILKYHGTHKFIPFAAILLLILGNLLGFVNLTLTILAGFAAVLVIGYVLFFSKSSA